MGVFELLKYLKQLIIQYIQRCCKQHEDHYVCFFSIIQVIYQANVFIYSALI